MFLVFETFVATILGTVLVTVVWVSYRRKRAASLLVSVIALRTVLAFALAQATPPERLVAPIVLFDVLFLGSIATMLFRGRVFETTRDAIDQALESMAAGIAVLDVKGKVLYANRAMEDHLRLRAGRQLTVGGADHDEASVEGGAALDDLLPPTRAEGTGDVRAPESRVGRSTLQRVERELLRGSSDDERTEICVDRRDHSLVVTASPVRGRGGRLEGYLLVTRDVTEARTFERELRKRNAALHRVLDDLKEGKLAEERANREKAEAEAANIAKSTFLANMSHELRTPLNAILGFVQLMERDRTLVDAHRDSLQVIGKSGQHLLRLINDILEMSKIEAGRISLTENTFDLHRILTGLEAMFSAEASKKGLKLVFDRDPEVPQLVRSDEGKLRQVLINLLGNAVKFTDRGRVKLRAEVASGPRAEGSSPRVGLRFTVSDTGRGIAPEDRARLFEPFTQAGDDKENIEGTGLGLSISREFVRLMGGEIKVVSELGEGSTFSFTVEVGLADPEELPRDRRDRVAIGLASGQPGYRILVVDDQWENRDLLVKLLQLVGLEVRGVENGLEAIEQWTAWEPHLVWMDMRMPVMDGYEATKRIKASLRGQATVVIALTASAFEHDRAMVLSVGCDDFVRKPFRDAEIFEKMEAHLGVRFVYEDRCPASVARPSPDRILDGNALERLARDLVGDLRRAAIELNTKAVQAAIEKVREDDDELAEALAELVRGYRFDTILSLTERAGETP